MRAVWRAVRVFVTLAMCFTAATASVQAVEAHKGSPPKLIRLAGGMSIDQAVEMVERRYNARVIRAEAHAEGGRTVYVLRLMNDAGRVWIVRVDATSGAVM